ncbi:hypothetical protein [Streptomyces sp. NPDC002215]|uniref:hypothetical protein n=1 Tax=Streptomyces sp. NPDC002215 TaxID=3154412 RepID=UPI00331E8D88
MTSEIEALRTAAVVTAVILRHTATAAETGQAIDPAALRVAADDLDALAKRPSAAGDMGGATPADMSHAMLIAILMNAGGSIELPTGAFDRDAIGTIDGSFHAVAMEPLGTRTLRISVQPRPTGDAGGITRI